MSAQPHVDGGGGGEEFTDSTSPRVSSTRPIGEGALRIVGGRTLVA